MLKSWAKISLDPGIRTTPQLREQYFFTLKSLRLLATMSPEHSEEIVQKHFMIQHLSRIVSEIVEKIIWGSPHQNVSMALEATLPDVIISLTVCIEGGGGVRKNLHMIEDEF